MNHKDFVTVYIHATKYKVTSCRQIGLSISQKTMAKWSNI